MKSLISALLVAVGGLLLASPASAATVEWRGGGYLTSASQACLDDGYLPTEYVSVRFRPRGLGDNGPNTKISFFHPLFFATSYVRMNGNFAKSFKPVVSGGVGGGPYVIDKGAKLKATMTPSSVKAGTQTVRIVGEIRYYGGTVGCNMTFDVNLTKRP